MTSSDLPTVFLPPLPRQSLNTLSPLTPEVVTSHITHLRTLLVPSIYGVDTTSSKSKADPSKIGDVENGSPSASASELSQSIGSNASSLSSRSSNSNPSTHVTLDEFEREWAEKWLHGLITRGEGWLAEVEPEADEDEDELVLELEDGKTPEMDDEMKAEWAAYTEREKVLMDASALISSLAGCAAGGGITRDLVFSLDLSRPGLGKGSTTYTSATHRTTAETITSSIDSELVLKIYDAPLSDHTSVGVQTWGSAILLGRIFALEPWKYLMPSETPSSALASSSTTDSESAREPRILELGAGTGVMSILARRILDRIGMQGQGKVLATDYHPLVLENLQKCIRLNFGGDGQPADEAGQTSLTKRRSRSRSILSSSPDSSRSATSHLPAVAGTGVPGLETMLLDWSTFPGIVDEWSGSTQAVSQDARGGDWTLPESISPAGSSLTQQMRDTLDTPWDMIIAADCVYDTRHAGMIRDVVKWCLRLPELNEKDEVVREGGVLHLLSPIRPTYAAETESIVRAFPAADLLPPRAERRARIGVDDRDTSDDLGPNVLVAGLSARLGALGFGGHAHSSSGTSTPNAHIRQHVPSTNNSSGQATPRRFTPTTTSTSATGTKSSIGSSAAVGTGPVAPGEDRATKDQVDPFGLEVDVDQLLASDMGIGRADGWVLATTQRRELQRMHGNGRSDEVEYWWWEIRWC